MSTFALEDIRHDPRAIEAAEKTAHEALSLLTDVSSNYNGSVTAQAAEIARRSKEAQSKPGYISPAELGKNFLASETAVNAFMERGHTAHINSVRQRIKADGKEPTPEVILQYMKALRLPSREIIEEKTRYLIQDTFDLAQQMLILSPRWLNRILRQYGKYHNRLVRTDKDTEEEYRNYVKELLQQKQEQDTAITPPAKTAKKPLIRRLFGRPKGRHAAGAVPPSPTHNPDEPPQ
jgi:histone H3/H4